MIGVVAEPLDLDVASEFFELFKTPWEPAVAGRTYSVVLCTSDRHLNVRGGVCLMYGSAEYPIDRISGTPAVSVQRGPIDVEFDGTRLPLSGSVATFGASGNGLLKLGRRSLINQRDAQQQTVYRIGYDLFREAKHLLENGQAPLNALVPTLELHIALLRRLMLTAGVSFVEVPPRPWGYDFSCCLTHDLDFFGIRRHALDKTLAGFIARASVGSVVDWLRGRRPWSEVRENWRALFRLPFVFLGVARDFWHPIDDYERADGERPSTYFVIPFRNRPGVGPGGESNPQRAVKYQASDVHDELRRAVEQGSELALHGIDAWHDAAAGIQEMAQLATVTGQRPAGVRMHWLYFSKDTPQHLEAVGFDYDSTYGYNDAIGYRPGTSQAFRIAGTKRLMELPLAIMDSAMFFRGRLALSRNEARSRWCRIVSNARHFGGTVVINWHDRSLAPERQWGESYMSLLEDIRRGGRAWFGTASQVVDWFRWRRSITFDVAAPNQVRVASASRSPMLPAATLQLHRPSTVDRVSVEECCFEGDRAMAVAL